MERHNRCLKAANILLPLLVALTCSECLQSARTQNATITYRWVYRNPASILDPAAIDTGKGSTNGTVNSVNSTVPRGYEPRLRYNHMGILSHLPNGSIAAAWQATPKWFEGPSDQGVWWAISDDYGLTWGPTRQIIPAADSLPQWGPVLHSQNGTIHVWYSHSHSACTWLSEYGSVWAPGGDLTHATSSDGGRTWSNGTVIFPWADLGGISKLSCNGVSINTAGDWLLPFWMELGGAPVCQRVPKLHGVAGVMISPDQGATWKRATVPKNNQTWMIENAVAGYTDTATGKPMQLQVFRTRDIGSALQSWSKDGGVTWGNSSVSELHNPNSRMDILALPNDTLVAVYNDSPTRRTPLVLAISQSGGSNWTKVATIEDDPTGSFHYPALLYDRVKDIVMVIYTVSYPPRLIPISLLLPNSAISTSVDGVPTAGPSPPLRSPGARNGTAVSATSLPGNATARGNATAPAPSANATSDAPAPPAEVTFLLSPQPASTTPPPAVPAPAPSGAAGAQAPGGAAALTGSGRRRRLLLQREGQFEDLPAADEAGMQEEGDDEEAAGREASEGEWQALEARGFARVPGLPTHAREVGGFEIREAAARAGVAAGNAAAGDGGMAAGGRRRVLGDVERRRLKDKFVEEQANFGRVCYGMRIVRLDRGQLVDGQYLPQ